MKYDDASWHYDGDFPKELPREAGGIHMGMFLAWLIVSHLESNSLKENAAKSLEAVRHRQMTGNEFLFKECDGKLTDEEINEEGNSFAKYYFEAEDAPYLDDYDEALAKELPSLYYVSDTWENFDKLKKLIDQRFTAWKKGGGPTNQ